MANPAQWWCVVAQYQLNGQAPVVRVFGMFKDSNQAYWYRSKKLKELEMYDEYKVWARPVNYVV